MRRATAGGQATAALSRRNLVGSALAAAAVAPFIASCDSDHPSSADRGSSPRIAIVGAGLAGLTCAYELSRSRVPSTLYEANPDRIGGRCWTSRGWGNGQTAEHGGEFIDTVHHSIRRLAADLGLVLDDLDAVPATRPPARDRYFLLGEGRTVSEVYAGYHRLRDRADADVSRIGPVRYDRAGRAARALDEMTAEQWLDAVLGDDEPLLRAATAQYMAEEYGLDLSRLSALTMVTENASGGLPSDERFHVRGGSDQLVTRLADRLPDGSVVRDAALSRLVRLADGSYRLGFTSGPDVAADVVVLAAPFASLRHADLDGSGLSDRKLACIRTLGMGTNAKLLVQLDHRLTRYGATPRSRWSGDYYDARVDTWDSSAAESGPTGLLTVYSGGRVGAAYPAREPHGRAPGHVVAWTLAEIDRAVPGVARAFAGRAWLDAWVDDPFTRGSYAAFGPGQVTRYWGFVGVAEGRLHFAGEHTSMRAQGFLDGAVASGLRAAREILAGM